MIESQENLSEEAKKKIARRKIFQKYGIYFILLLLLIFSAIVTNGISISISNILNILVHNTPVALIAMGVTIVIISGGIDLSLGSVIAFSAVMAAGFGQIDADRKGLPFIIPVIVGLATGTACGLTNGLLITKTKIPPFIATLGMLTAARGFALVTTKMFTPTGSISGLHPGFRFLGQGRMLGLYMPIWILVIMIIISHTILRYTRMGRYSYAIGGNPKAAEVSGIDSDRYLIMIYSYAGMLAGLAGIVLVGILNSAQPTLGILYELDAIAASVIGGTSLSAGIGSIPTTIVGAFFVGILKNTMDLKFISAYWQDIARGVVIVMAVVLDMLKMRK